jgi:hypothetical protein
MKINNGNLPATPFTQEPYPIGAIGNSYGPMATGLTKREMFAMAAMQGILSSLPSNAVFSYQTTAKCSVEQADALLAELEKTKCED